VKWVPVSRETGLSCDKGAYQAPNGRGHIFTVVLSGFIEASFGAGK
jgi:hypothetical protein